MSANDLKSGELIRLSSRVSRIIAPNPSAMTGPGTNTYLVGDRDIAVIDPGPDDESHIQAIIDAIPVGARIRWVLVTHAHYDHSQAAVVLAERTGAKMLGPKPLQDHFEDSTFQPQHEVKHDEVLRLGECAIRAIHTPGHIGNHFCYLIEEDQLLLTGDHIMSGSTVVIVPPSGDMKDYLASLELLRSYPLRQLGPGHGDVMDNPLDVVQGIIDHRLRREEKVLKAMQQLRRATLDELTPVVYDDVPLAMHPIAQLSLLAHLIKLERESILRQIEDSWHL